MEKDGKFKKEEKPKEAPETPKTPKKEPSEKKQSDSELSWAEEGEGDPYAKIQNQKEEKEPQKPVNLEQENTTEPWNSSPNKSPARVPETGSLAGPAPREIARENGTTSENKAFTFGLAKAVPVAF